MSPRSITLFHPNAPEDLFDPSLGARIVAAHEDIVVAASDPRGSIMT